MLLLENSKYLVLSGGGVNGFCLLGPLKAIRMLLGKKNLSCHFEGFCGTSIGALICLALVCDLTCSDILQCVTEFSTELCIFRFSVTNFISYKGGKKNMYPFNIIISRILTTRCSVKNAHLITFRNLYDITKKQLVVISTNILTMEVEHFDYKKTPNVSVLKAVLASMSVPIVYPPVCINEALYCDGALVLNLPFTIFPKEETLGLWLESRKTIAKKEVLLQDCVAYVKQISKCMYYSQDTLFKSIIFPKYRKRVIVIPTQNNLLPSSEEEINYNSMARHGFMAMFIHLFHFCELDKYDISKLIISGIDILGIQIRNDINKKLRLRLSITLSLLATLFV